MNIILTINAENPAELLEAVNGLAALGGGKVITLPQTTDKPSKSRTKTPDPAIKEPVVDPDPIHEETEDPAEHEDDDAPIPSVVDLRAKAQEVGKTPDDKKAIKALLDKYESKSISDVPEEKRTAFLADLGKI